MSSGAPILLRGPERPDLIREESLAEILHATVQRLPEQTALIWGQRSVSYQELFTLSGQMGSALVARGAGPGQVIGLWLPRGADLLIAQAGIAQSGAAWLPLDAATPLERLLDCLIEAQAIGLVTCRDWLPRLQAAGIPAWAYEELLAEAQSVPRPSAGPYDPAYVIYTSGSTGKPKGIVIRQRGICHFLRAENELLGVTAKDRVYQGFSVAFDMSFEEIWISYLVGATLWIAPPSIAADPENLAQAVAREKITVLHAVPTLMGLLTEVPTSVRKAGSPASSRSGLGAPASASPSPTPANLSHRAMSISPKRCQFSAGIRMSRVRQP